MQPTPKTTVVTYLEMRSQRRTTRPWPDGALRIERLERPTVRFYRYLYEAVGSDWCWFERRHMADAALEAVLTDPLVEVHLLTAGGVPQGYGELDRRENDVVWLAYFGLVPEAVGRGFGRWFLEQIVARAWASGPSCLRVHTCDLDHPRALANYLAGGFEVYDRREELVSRHDQALPRVQRYQTPDASRG